MNETSITTCGYAGSDMVKVFDRTKAGNGDCTKIAADDIDKTGLGQDGSTLHEIYDKYISKDFTDAHVIQYQNLLTNAMEQTRYNRFGQNTGASSSWGWYPRKLDLMSEMNVYGGIVASSSIFDTGIDNRQYALFRLKPELMYSYNGARFDYWLKDVATSTDFVHVWHPGASDTTYTSDSVGVRPRFLIGWSSFFSFA